MQKIPWLILILVFSCGRGLWQNSDVKTKNYNPITENAPGVATGPETQLVTPGMQGTRGDAPRVDGLRITRVNPDHGPVSGRVTVTIIGSGFQDNSEVFFDGVPCDYPFYISPRIFNCTLPAHPPGTVDVAVRNPGQGTARLKQGFTYESPVSLEGCKPDKGVVQGGEPMAVTGSGFSKDCIFMLGDRALAGVRITDDGHAFGLTPPGKPGDANLAVICDRGRAELGAAFHYYDPGSPPQTGDFTVQGVDPKTGPAMGGTRVMIFGHGFRKGLSVLFGGVPAMDVKVVSSTIIQAVTPPGSPGPVDVVVAEGMRQFRLKQGFIYRFGRVKVLDVRPNGASIAGNGIIGIMGLDLPKDAQVYFGQHRSGEVVFSDPNHILVRAPAVDSPETVDITLVSHGNRVKAQQDFTFFNPTRQPGGAYGGPIRRTVNLAVLANWRDPLPEAVVLLGDQVLHTDKRGLVTFSEMGFKGPVTVTAVKDGFSASTYVNMNAQNITLTISKKPDPDGTPPEPAKPVYCTFKGRILDFDKYGGGLPGQSEHRLVVCSTSFYSIYGTNPDPGPGAIPDPDGNFQITTRTGKLALVCTLSINRGKGFVAERIGIVSGLVCSKERPETDGILVNLNIPLRRNVYLRFGDLPPSPFGVKGPYVRFRFRLGEEGYIDFNQKYQSVTNNIIRMTGQPVCLKCIKGTGYRFDLYASENTNNSLPYTRVQARDVMPLETVRAMVVSDKGTDVLDLSIPWEVSSAAGKDDFMVIGGSETMATGTPDHLTVHPVRPDSMVTALYVQGKCDYFAGLDNGRVMHCTCKTCEDMTGLDKAVKGLVVTGDHVLALADHQVFELVNNQWQPKATDVTVLSGGEDWWAIGTSTGKVLIDRGMGLNQVAALKLPVAGICQGRYLTAVTQRRLWIQGTKVAIPAKHEVFGVICSRRGPLVYGDAGMALQYTDNHWETLSDPELNTAFTAGARLRDQVFLSGITYMEFSDFLDFPRLQVPKDNSANWDGSTIAWMPMREPEPSFCQGLISQPGVWTFWVILSGGGTSVVHLPDLVKTVGYALVPSGPKVLNITCGLKPGFDFNNFSRYDTGMYNLPAYSVNMVHFE